jgi:hypothetical protein
MRSLKLSQLIWWRLKSHSIIIIRGSCQKFCTLYVFSLKINLIYKIHLQAFNVISIVLYHSGPTFGQVFYSCLDAFVVDASDYSSHLIRHLLNASEAFPKELCPNLKKPLRGKLFRSIEEVSNEVIWVIRPIKNEGVQTGIQDLPKRWIAVIKHSGIYIEGL